MTTLVVQKPFSKPFYVNDQDQGIIPLELCPLGVCTGDMMVVDQGLRYFHFIQPNAHQSFFRSELVKERYVQFDIPKCSRVIQYPGDNCYYAIGETSLFCMTLCHIHYDIPFSKEPYFAYDDTKLIITKRFVVARILHRVVVFERQTKSVLYDYQYSHQFRLTSFDIDNLGKLYEFYREAPVPPQEVLLHYNPPVNVILIRDVYMRKFVHTIDIRARNFRLSADHSQLIIQTFPRGGKQFIVWGNGGIQRVFEVQGPVSGFMVSPLNELWIFGRNSVLLRSVDGKKDKKLALARNIDTFYDRLSLVPIPVKNEVTYLIRLAFLASPDSPFYKLNRSVLNYIIYMVGIPQL